MYLIVLHGGGLTKSYTLAIDCLRQLEDPLRLLLRSEPATILRIGQEAYTQGNESVQ